MAFNYPGTKVYVPMSSAGVPDCPKCGGKTKDDGECSEGCCDYRKCEACGYRYRIEWPD